MPWPVHPNGLLGAQGDNDSYQISRSLRFNSSDSAYLNRTPASAGNRKTWTWSGWVKISRFSSDINLFDGGATGPLCSIWIDSTTNKIRWYFTNSAVSASESAYTSALIRDPSAWYHFVFALDTTQATLSERAKIYINGVQQTLTGLTGTYLTQNSDQGINRNVAHYIGAYSYTGLQSFFDGYLTEINFIDGQALTPSSFGETDAITGWWKAKAYSGTYGTNGFYLKFADNSGTTSTTLGKDSSPNGNNWTPNNFSVDNTTNNGIGNDSLVESPTNYGTDTGLGGEVRGNYCTFNPLKRGSTYANLSNGNLTITGTTGGAGQQSVQSTIGMSSGKWYAEAIITTVGAESSVGIARDTQDTGIYVGAGAFSYGYYLNGLKYNNGSGTSYGSSFTSGDVIGVAFNADAGSLVFYKNGVSQGTAFTGLTSGPYVFEGSGRSATSGNQNDWNFGQRPWKYTAPTGFKALCTTNLTTPTIKKPSSYMDAVTFTATGANQTITGFNFSPDLVWIKNRANWAGNRHTLYDTTRGAVQRLDSSTTEAEAADNDLYEFNSNGFSGNLSGTTYVAWAWDEAPIAGMDIVSYTGTGVARTVAHNLGVAPKMMIVKSRSRSGDNWDVYHASVGATGRLYLNLTNATDTSIAPWNNTAPTSSVFTVGTAGDTNANGVTYIAYLFAEVEGFSKFGSYTGNGSADGPFVWCGFRPRWVMIKRSDTPAVLTGWGITDSLRSDSNVVSLGLVSDSSLAEFSGNATTASPYLDYLSNGFKIRNTGGAQNTTSVTYIFAAFAESPFKYARAR